MASPIRYVLALAIGCSAACSGEPAPAADGGRSDAGCSRCGNDSGPSPERDASLPLDGGPPPTCETSTEPMPLAFEPLAESADLVAPGRGAAAWHGRSDVDVPIEGGGAEPLDDYFRMVWTALERSAGDYDFTRLDQLLNDAIDRRQKLSFGIMSACPGCDTDELIMIDGARSAYPADLHRAMQAEAQRDWISDGHWIPNWNSAAYLSRYEALLRAVNAHLEDGEHAGVRYRDAIGTIDVRGYGSWGEWHVAGIADTVDDQPPGRATPATLNRLIDMHVEAFPRHALVLMICIFDSGRYGNMGIPAEVTRHALGASNDFGPLGWRRDNWGALDPYLRDLLDRHPEDDIRDALMERWRTSPIVGEPPYYDTTADGCAYSDLETQILRYHAAWFGNGNYGGAESQRCMRDNVRAAARAAGYRLVLEGGSAPSVLYAGARAELALRWHNTGIAPTYESWEVVFELRDSSDTSVWSSVSSFDPRLFLPGDAMEIRDAPVVLESLAAGTYDLVVTVRDPIGYRAPLPLAIEGRRGDGSYLLRSVTVLECP